MVEALRAHETQSFVHRTERGELRLSIPAPTILVFEYQGYTDGTFIPFIERVWEEAFGNATVPIQVFANTEAQTGYGSDFRTGMIQWSRRSLGKTDVYVLLVKSRWVAMGIAIVRATIGLPARHVEVTSKRELFQTKLDAAVRRSLARSAG